MNTPFERFFDLASLSAGGKDVRVVAKPDELERIAEWAELPSLQNFEAVVTLRKLSHNRFLYSAALSADAIQSCVASLAPVPAHVEKTFERELHLVSHAARDLAAHGDVVVGDVDEEEGPQDIESTRYDLGAPLLEEFVLALDPYPRAPGVVFESLEPDADKPESPFAMLKTLKNND